MPNTPVLGLPYPSSADTADVPRDVKALADSLDAQQSFLPIGALILWALAAPPAGNNANGRAAWLLCNGQTVSATDYPKLAALLGAPGGNITIPDLRDRVPLGASATRPVGSAGGEASHVITAAELPSHGHGHNIATASGGSHTHTPPTSGWRFVLADRDVASAKTDVSIAGIVSRAAYTIGSGGSFEAGLFDSATATFAAGAHTHGMTGGVSASAAPTQQTNLMQPYLSLSYVMRAA